MAPGELDKAARPRPASPALRVLGPAPSTPPSRVALVAPVAVPPVAAVPVVGAMVTGSRTAAPAGASEAKAPVMRDPAAVATRAVRGQAASGRAQGHVHGGPPATTVMASAMAVVAPGAASAAARVVSGARGAQVAIAVARAVLAAVPVVVMVHVVAADPGEVVRRTVTRGRSGGHGTQTQLGRSRVVAAGRAVPAMPPSAGVRAATEPGRMGRAAVVLARVASAALAATAPVVVASAAGVLVAVAVRVGQAR
jgi:hypothetical protein